MGLGENVVTRRSQSRFVRSTKILRQYSCDMTRRFGFLINSSVDKLLSLCPYRVSRVACKIPISTQVAGGIREGYGIVCQRLPRPDRKHQTVGIGETIIYISSRNCVLHANEIVAPPQYFNTICKTTRDFSEQ